jgi:fumarate hydratase class II
MIQQDSRVEKDSLGEVRVPRTAYWGPQTQRALENFAISGLRFPRSFLRAMGMIKSASAAANEKLGRLSREIADAVSAAALEVMEGRWDDQFVLDIFQTGSGTSTNMNANEVIASRANEILGGRIGEKKPVHPNDHVNLGQSSNDVIPSCIHIAAAEEIHKNLLPALETLKSALAEKAAAFDYILKVGRTHLQDATPIRLGQEFSGYAGMVQQGIRTIEKSLPRLAELALGGTAVGTGLNTHPRFAGAVIERINELTALPRRFHETENHFEAQASRDGIVEISSALKTMAVSLMKIANDIRWLGSGPRCGLGEIILPPVQPGSSIMPGKINPVIPEALCQVAAQVAGNDATLTIAGMSGNFELNTMMPVMAHNLLQSIRLLSNASSLFTQKCIRGIKADANRCREEVEKSLAMATALSAYIGYDAAAEIAREAYDQGKTIREIAAEKKILSKDVLERALDPRNQTEPA